MRPGRSWTELWLFDLRQGPLLAAGHDLLDAEDHRRAASLVSPVQAREFLASRVALRLVLTHYGGDPRAVFGLGENGKPCLPDGPCFSLSRTRHAALVAVSDAAVGVDLEFRRPLDLAELRLVEAADVLRSVHGFAGAGNEPLQTWTAIEAWIKYHGGSLREFLDTPHAPAELAKDLAARRVSLRPLDLPPGLCGSVCMAADSALVWRAAKDVT